VLAKQQGVISRIQRKIAIEYLICAAGAAGSGEAPGGGGEVLVGEMLLALGAHPVVVPGPAAGDGGNASFAGLTARGGKVGGESGNGFLPSARLGGASTLANGLPGLPNAGGGNGGARGGGAEGLASDINGTSTKYGSGGGGGGYKDYDALDGFAIAKGLGGTNAGNGGETGDANPGGNGVAHRGGGGGGGGHYAEDGEDHTGTAGLGGSGVAVARYRTGHAVATGGVITTFGVWTIHTFNADDVFLVGVGEAVEPEPGDPGQFDFSNPDNSGLIGLL
jgi:hypothetical protein